MKLLDEQTAARITLRLADKAMEGIEAHIDAHPLRFARARGVEGGHLSGDAYAEIRERIEFATQAVLRELTI